MRSIAPGGVPHLKLTTLTLSAGGSIFDGFLIFDLLDDVLYLTTLWLDGARLHDNFLLVYKPDLAPFAPITSLTLTHCEINLDQVARLAGACESLAMFKLVHNTVLFPDAEATESFFRAL